MSDKAQKLIFLMVTMALLLLFSGITQAADPSAPSAGVMQGALAWENWTKTVAGGTGDLPDGVTNQDYIRCKACHGWDILGTDGGYTRRSRKDTRPNAGAGDGDSTSRAIARGSVTAEMIAHAGTGRTFAQGTGSWVALDGTHSSDNKAANANGYTLGNQHPDFSGSLAAGEGLAVGADITAAQIDALVEFLNFEDAGWDAYFEKIDPTQNPVLYTIVSTADAAAGETFYDANCSGCHGDPAGESPVGHPEGGILDFFGNDGKPSEFAHKARWGSGTMMTRATIGSPGSADVANMMLWLQELGGTGLAMNPGHDGTWRGDPALHSGEGMQIEVGYSNGVLTVVVYTYTYDDMGNLLWLIAKGPVIGNTAILEVTVTSDGSWGESPLVVTRTPWGTGTLVLNTCKDGHISLVPDVPMMGGNLEYDIMHGDILDGGNGKCPTPTGWEID